MNNIFGTRLAALRQKRGLSTLEAAFALGLGNATELAALESGKVQPTADIIVRAVDSFNISIETLTDPFRLVDEGRFSWRQSGVSQDRLTQYEQHAGSFIAAYRFLSPKFTRGSTDQTFRLANTSAASRLIERSKFETVSSIAENLVKDLGLGPVPADTLPNAIERNLGILVLMVDPTDGVSGAACKLSDLDVILINRNDVPGRRNFDLGHELFHILTWRAMPPAHIEDVNERNKSRVEQLADIFASSLLMPAHILDRYGEWSSLSGDHLVDKLNAVADELRVTSSALRWRLASLGRITQTIAKEIAEERLRFNGKVKPELGQLPTLFSSTFMKIIGQSLLQGELSVRRAANLLQVNVDELRAVFLEYGIEPPFEI
ncbi:ImmA/IrrE family metallo-endopeptidase [Rhizobium leguminosarum]|uniref:XRE family transcriptional regulator n=1 Tax=Rhizobium leguminosarum TaxID=384 RepID=UPI001C94E617|nr:XRE family transcriptional regulator [Rhizobium leguminosarum]MBY5566615.1 ImmA/IrrE family metallo-endopeptidase [Rhizobium leguminosarum]MBY5573893.1 ImmA/IrrE family metallo-endopeptidase [Rhizobium leguminosarum]